MPKTMLMPCGKWYNKKKPSNLVIATGKQNTVKQFANHTLQELNIKCTWKSKGIKSKCYDAKSNCIIQRDKV